MKRNCTARPDFILPSLGAPTSRDYAAERDSTGYTPPRGSIRRTAASLNKTKFVLTLLKGDLPWNTRLNN